MGTILIENSTLVTVNDKDEIIKQGYIFIDNDVISSIASGDAPSKFKNADIVIDGHLKAVIPGMVNAHTHLFQTFIRGLADDKPLLDWLKTAIWPVAHEMKEEEAYMAAMVGLIENIRGGATSVIDHQYIHADSHNDDGVCQAADEIGVRFLLARGWADMDYHPTLMETPDRIIAETTRLRDKWEIKGKGKTRVEYGPLIPWGCSDDTMMSTYKMSKQWGAGTHIHVAETKTEVDMNLELRGKRHIEWLADLGILGPDFQLVHSVWLSDFELDLVEKYKAVVVHCPVSNMYLASGVARVPEMLAKGIRVALATDGPGSNNNQDMIAVLKTTALLHKVSTLNAMVLLPEDILRMACQGGSYAFGLPEKIGSLEIGKKADIVLMDLDTPMAMPVHRVPSALIYNLSTRDVDTVIVDGKILMKDKEIIVVDEKAILARARKVCEKLFIRAGVRVD
jgi:5-methylthioadenosine/S-adenosylhomocysteine deaminase